MIELSNKHRFEYMVASGALAFDGEGWFWEKPLKWLGLLDPTLFTVVIKTLTFKPREGNLRWYNPFRCIRLIRKGLRVEGTLNSVGLTNKGYLWWCHEVGPNVSKKMSLVGSIFCEDPEEVLEMCLALNPFDFVAIELNASCPNTESGVLENTEKIVDCCKKAKDYSRFPLILKLSVIHDVERIIPEVEGIIEAVSINSVPWNIVYPHKKSPLAHLGGGGVSGKVASPYTWDFVEMLAYKFSVPVIGPSVWDFKDIQGLRDLGAEAISFGSVFLPYPWRPTLFVRRDIRRLARTEKGERI